MLWIVLAICVRSVVGSPHNSSETPGETLLDQPPWEVRDQWIKLHRTTQMLAESVLQQIEPFLVKVIREVKISSACSADIMRSLSGVRELKEWALKMVDSNGKLPSGILSGTFHDLGDYDGCLSVVHPEGRFKGQYCSVHYRPHLPKIPLGQLSHRNRIFNVSSFVQDDSGFKIISDRAVYFYRLAFSQGLCVPSSCKRQEVERIMFAGYRESGLIASVPYCDLLEKPGLQRNHFIVIGFFTLVVALVVISTTVEIFYRGTNFQDVPKLWTYFSLYTNYHDFLDAGHDNRLNMLNGLKVITMLWLTLVHTYLFTPLFVTAGMLSLEDIVEDYYFQIVGNSWLAVEVYMIISGLLMSYSTLRCLERSQGKINFMQLTMKRIWRLWPAMWAVLGMLIMMPYLYSGPFWQETVVQEADLCNRRWWTAMFFANSWMRYDEACLVHMWYVSADLQLYIISLIFIYFIYRNPKSILNVCLPVILLGGAATGLTTYLYDLQPSIIYESPNEKLLKRTIDLTYFRPWTHLGPYIMGVLLGYVLNKNNDFPLKPAVVMGGWLTALSIFTAVLFAPYNWHRGFFPTREFGAFYQAIQKTAFSLPIIWTIFACYYGHGGAFNRMLAWRGFVPFGKLSYLIYLSQMPLIWFRNGSRRQRFQFTHFNQVYEFFGNCVVTVGVALVLYLLVEQPFASLQSLLFPTNNKTNGKIKETKEE